MERYVAILNEPDARARRDGIAELWAPDAEFISETSVKKGHSAIEAEALHAHQAYVAKGFLFSSGNLSQRHHHLARLKWHLQAKQTGELRAAGSDLLILDEAGRIRFDYQFSEPVQGTDRPRENAAP